MVLFHVPNESGKNTVRYGEGQNSIGRIAGDPDYVLCGPKKTVFMEVKSEKGTMSHRKKDFKEWCLSVCIQYVVVLKTDCI